MPEMGKTSLLETRSGSPITAHGMTITPQSQVVGMRWPGGGWVWNRPVGVQVERGGQTEHYPIVNVTRIVQIILHTFTFFFFVLVLVQMVKERSD